MLLLLRELVWNFLCIGELLLSTVIHLTYAATIVGAVLLSDFSLFVRGWTSARRRRRRDAEPDDQKSKPTLSRPPSLNAGTAAAARMVSGTTIEEPLERRKNGQEPVQKPRNGATPMKHRHGRNGSGAFHLTPIVLIHGIFGFGHGKLGNLSYFGGAELQEERVLVPDLGSLTSIHDSSSDIKVVQLFSRACELFSYLKGGAVDYGEEHSRQAGHDRYGRTYLKGHYEEWSDEHPVHFVGHSSGVQVARLLQTMLAEKAFAGNHTTSDRWVASITSLSGAMNGTTRVFIDGISPTDGKSMHPIALVQVLRVGIIIYEFLDLPSLKNLYSFGFEHFRMAWHQMGIWGLLCHLASIQGPFLSGDWVLPDLSIQYTIELNKKLKTYPNTYYFSYATVQTRKFFGRTIPASPNIHPLFILRTLQMGQWRHPTYYPRPYDGYRDEDWHDNDGALNTISMLYPRLPEEHPNLPLDANSKSFKPGIWYYSVVNADHIYFIMNKKRAGPLFDSFYNSVFRRCRDHLTPSPALATLCACADECTCKP
eukprot:SM000096S24854  [mRNA]  locus=s96:111677:115526:+ [translate_table: standard]